LRVGRELEEELLEPSPVRGAELLQRDARLAGHVSDSPRVGVDPKNLHRSGTCVADQRCADGLGPGAVVVDGEAEASQVGAPAAVERSVQGPAPDI